MYNVHSHHTTPHHKSIDDLLCIHLNTVFPLNVPIHLFLPHPNLIYKTKFRIHTSRVHTHVWLSKRWTLNHLEFLFSFLFRELLLSQPKAKKKEQFLFFGFLMGKYNRISTKIYRNWVKKEKKRWRIHWGFLFSEWEEFNEFLMNDSDKFQYIFFSFE